LSGEDIEKATAPTLTSSSTSTLVRIAVVQPKLP